MKCGAIRGRVRLVLRLFSWASQWRLARLATIPTVARVLPIRTSAMIPGSEEHTSSAIASQDMLLFRQLTCALLTQFDRG